MRSTGERSTDVIDRKSNRATRRFFDEELIPLGRELKASGTSLLQTHHAADAASYYILRARRHMAPKDFEWGGADSPDTLQAALVRLWSDPASLPWRCLAPGLGELARALQRADDSRRKYRSSCT